LNNALSLNVFRPGEVAATAGTSGVIYGVTDSLKYDPASRINSFAHVNHEKEKKSIGVLLCINGTGIFNKWVRNLLGTYATYDEMNQQAASIPAGSDGLLALPFGNGAERMLNNRIIGAHFSDIDLNLHTPGHMVRAAQEGIAFAFRFGLDVMRETGFEAGVIRAGKANLFRSRVFVESFVNATGVPVELYETDGSVGAALGAGIGAGFFTEKTMFSQQPLQTIEPTRQLLYDNMYGNWKQLLQNVQQRFQPHLKPERLYQKTDI
jgi:xylulokinase